MSDSLPDIAAVVSPLLADVTDAERPVVSAYVERVAAGRYRTWASQVASADHVEKLLACAAREEEIAQRVEDLWEDAQAIQTRFAGAHPDLQSGYDGLFSGRPLADQMRIQAAAERLGAATWRALAEAAEPGAKDVLASCAPLEEESAAVLDALIAEGV